MAYWWKVQSPVRDTASLTRAVVQPPNLRFECRADEMNATGRRVVRVATPAQIFSGCSIPVLGLLHRPDRDPEKPCRLFRTKRKVQQMDSIEKSESEKLSSLARVGVISTPDAFSTS
jgi:hypothetical protein